jgi:hypothetical protein
VRGSRSELRSAVREFLAEEVGAGAFVPGCDQWMQGFSPDFSRKLGQMGWLGMTWPKRYGGRDAPPGDRHAVVEELLAAGAPVAAHWFAERQTGPLLLRYGTEDQRERFLPGITRGEVYVSIGLSEPDSGSDLASVRTRAVAVDGGWRVTGQKIWTSHAHRAHLLVALVRTGEDRHGGLSQMLVPLDADGITVRPITSLAGNADFCEVFLDEVFVPDADVVGTIGHGWEQVTAELAAERSGPERFLSVHPLMAAWIDGPAGNSAGDASVGRAVASLWALRSLSADLVERLGSAGDDVPASEVAAIKDRGTVFEQDLVEVMRREFGAGRWEPGRAERAMLACAVLAAPSFTLRGGTNEILRSIVARDLEPGR